MHSADSIVLTHNSSVSLIAVNLVKHHLPSQKIEEQMAPNSLNLEGVTELISKLIYHLQPEE